MRFCFFTILCGLCLISDTVSAEGLPANPWAVKNVNIYGTADEIQNEDTRLRDSAFSATANNSEQEINELRNEINSLKEKMEKNNASQTNNQNQTDNVDATEALGALNTLSKYMEQKGSNKNAENIVNSTDIDGIKNKFSDMMNKGKSTIATQNSYAKNKMNKAKYEYNYYKSQLESDYNTIKNKARPLYNTVKKNVQDAGKAAGVNF